MSSVNRFLSLVAKAIGSTLFVVLLTRFRVWNSRKRILKKVDVFAEPFKETLNEFIDIIVVTFDLLLEVVATILPRRNTKPVKRVPGERTTPGRYVSAKV